MTSDNHSRIVIVLGMHRSGTSALTEALGHLGIHLGGSFKPALPENPRGFWEDKECLEINESLLRERNYTWADIFPTPTLSLRQEDSGYLSQASALLESRANEFRTWAFKDPRSCRALPFWRKACSDIAIPLNCVIVIRNPLSVAASLGQRNKMPLSQAFLLWAQHVIGSIECSSGLPRVVVDYDFLLASPNTELRRISTTLGLASQNGAGPSEAKPNPASLDSELRHANFSEADLQRLPAHLDNVTALYQLVRKSAKGLVGLDDSSFADEFQRLSSLLAVENCAVDFFRNTIRESRDVMESTIKALRVTQEEEVRGLKKKISELEIRLEDTTRLAHERLLAIHEMTESASWKITKPLRSVVQLSRSLGGSGGSRNQ